MEELKLDIEELKSLRQQATRRKVQDFLDMQVRRMETDLIMMEEQQMAKSNPDCVEVDQKPKLARPAGDTDRIYTAEIKTYAWDQSEKYFKLYISENMDGVGALEKDKVTATFTERSVRLSIRGLAGRNHELHIARLYDKILPNESSAKVKPNQVVLMLRKQSPSTWAYVTEVEKKEKQKKEAKKPSMKDEEDPSAGLMNLMRQMYEDGDDEMKRTIAKAWTESQEKRSAGGE